MTTATTSRLAIPDREFSESVQNQLQEFRRRLAELDSEIRSAWQELDEICGDTESSLADLRKRHHKSQERLHSLFQQLQSAAQDRQKLLTACRPEVEATLTQAGAELDKLRAAVGKALRKAGQAPEDNPVAAVNPQQAEAMFQRLVESSQPVRAAREAADQASVDLQTWQRLQQESGAVIQHQRDELRQLTRSILGS